MTLPLWRTLLHLHLYLCFLSLLNVTVFRRTSPRDLSPVCFFHVRVQTVVLLYTWVRSVQLFGAGVSGHIFGTGHRLKLAAEVSKT